MKNFINCGSEMIIYSAIISLLLSCTLTPERAKLVGYLFLGIGVNLIITESGCDVCAIGNVGNQCNIPNVGFQSNNCFYPYDRQCY